VRTITVEERRARLARRHRLVPTSRTDDDVAEIARSVVVLHATDPATVVLSALARMRRPDAAVVERALYEDRTVVRMLAMRRTLFTVPVDFAPTVHAAASAPVAADERRKLEQLLLEREVTKRPGPWLRKVEAKALAALDELGEASAAELAAVVPELDLQLTMNAGKRYEAKIRLASRVLVVLGADGRIVRARPRGAWTGATHRWCTTERWLGSPLADVDPDEARAELLRRWLERFGPGTVTDLAWWTGWSLGTTRQALAGLDTVDVDLDGAPGLVLAGDERAVRSPKPWAALLPGLDPTTMGWKERDWYLGAHKAQVFDTAGNGGPTVWVDGRIVGAWAQRRDGRVVHHLLEDLPPAGRALVDQQVARLQALLDDIRVLPRFPAPLDKELAAQVATS
jgi:hypothetical protein